MFYSNKKTMSDTDRVLPNIHSSQTNEDAGNYNGVLDIPLKNFSNLRASKWFNNQTNKTTISIARATINKFLTECGIDPANTNVYDSAGQLNFAIIASLQFEYIHCLHKCVTESVATVTQMKNELDNFRNDMSTIRKSFTDIDARINQTFNAKLEMLTAIMKQNETSRPQLIPQAPQPTNRVLDDLDERFNALQTSFATSTAALNSNMEELNKNQITIEQNNKTILKYVETLREPMEVISTNVQQVMNDIKVSQNETAQINSDLEVIRADIDKVKQDVEQKDKFTSEAIVQIHKNINDITNDVTGITRQANDSFSSEVGQLFKRVARLESSVNTDSMNVSNISTSKIKTIKPIIDPNMTPV